MRIKAPAALAMLAACLLAAAAKVASAPDAPKRIGLVERAGTHLAQIDVTVSGKQEIVDSLGPDDFEVRVLFKRVENVIVDRVCQTVAAPPAEDSSATAAPPPAAKTIPVRSRAATYLFYFDQPHLTMAGRQRAIDLARELVPKVIVGEARGMVVSSAKDLSTVETLTSDPAKLLAALTRLEKDRTQWSPYATLEGERVDEVLRILDDQMGGVWQAIGRARFYQAEEAWEMQKALNRLSMVMGALTDVDPPKAVFYFADTMRSRPGGHYLNLFSDRVQSTDSADQLQVDARFGSMTMDRIITEAAASGIRFYPIEAQGLVSVSMSEGIGFGASYQANNASLPSLARVREAQESLAAMALETGGQAFINGVAGAKIANKVLQDLSCVYLLSFDAEDRPVDEPLPIKVRVKKPGVSVQARGRLVIQSESSRLTSRLLAAFSTPRESRSDIPIGIRVIPIGYGGGAYTGLVQIFVPGSRYASASWDLGASVVSSGRVPEDASGHLEVQGAGVPIVLEKEMRFAPGHYEIVGVAHETTTDQIASRQTEGSWPDLRDVPAAIVPTAIVQPASGVFRRNGATQTHGPVARGESESVGSDLATAFVTLVCRGSGEKGAFRAERRLIGESEVGFEPQELELEKEPCAQIRDLVPAKTMGAGEFRYEVRLLKGGQEAARGERKFMVVAGGAPAGAEAPSPPQAPPAAASGS